MSDTSDTSLDDALAVLNPFIDDSTRGSREREAFKLAQAALLYIRDTQRLEDFAAYYKRFSDTSFTVEVSHSFATREEAEAWLASGQARDSQRVSIAGQGFMVVQLPDRLSFMVAPLPEELRAPQWTQDPE